MHNDCDQQTNLSCTNVRDAAETYVCLLQCCFFTTAKLLVLFVNKGNPSYITHIKILLYFNSNPM